MKLRFIFIPAQILQNLYQFGFIESYCSDEPINLIVTWNTINGTKESIVEYGVVENNITERAIGNATTFIDGGLAKRQQFVHRVKLTGLLSKQKYCNFYLSPI